MKLVIGAFIAAFIIVLGRGAFAHEEMGPQVNAWAQKLRSKAGEHCCSTSDWHPAEVTWDMDTGKYRVLLDGEWRDVPPEALVEGPNMAGFAMVWTFMQNDCIGTGLQAFPKCKEKKAIRCFIPGAGG